MRQNTGTQLNAIERFYSSSHLGGSEPKRRGGPSPGLIAGLSQRESGESHELLTGQRHVRRRYFRKLLRLTASRRRRDFGTNGRLRLAVKRSWSTPYVDRRQPTTNTQRHIPNRVMLPEQASTALGRPNNFKSY